MLVNIWAWAWYQEMRFVGIGSCVKTLPYCILSENNVWIHDVDGDVDEDDGDDDDDGDVDGDNGDDDDDGDVDGDDGDDDDDEGDVDDDNGDDDDG